MLCNATARYVHILSWEYALCKRTPDKRVCVCVCVCVCVRVCVATECIYTNVLSILCPLLWLTL